MACRAGTGTILARLLAASLMAGLLAGCDAVGGLFAARPSAGLTAFEQGLDAAAVLRADRVSADGRRYGYHLRRTGGLALIQGRFRNVKYGVKIDGSGTAPAGEDEATLIHDLTVEGWRRYDPYGAAVSVTDAAPVYISRLAVDMGQGPSSNYKQWNIDGITLEPGRGAPVTMLRDARIRNVTDALIDAKHRAVVGRLEGGNALHLVKVWGGAEVVISGCDLSLGLGRNFIQLIGDARVLAHDCRWRLPDGTVFTRLADIPARYIDLRRGAKRAQLVDLDTDPLEGVAFFEE